ncbi:MAG: ChaN family lipoprotein [Bacteroidales bacterium]
MKKFLSTLVVCLIIFSAKGQELNAYTIFTSKGEKVDFYEMVTELEENHVILFGELHDNPISHWLQLELTIQLYNNNNQHLMIGAEMFERDNQLIINEYLQGIITQTRFENEARLWPNYKTDYKPVVEFARENSIAFYATNIPRRYASMVSKGGFEELDKLSDEAKKYIAPLPVEYDPELPGYKAMLKMMGMPGSKGNKQNFPKAQAIKDATMAWSIATNYKVGSIFLHMHGTYHSNNFEGIAWYLNQYKPELKLKTIATALQDDVDTLKDENQGIADFIIVVPSRMTRTY